MNTTSLTVRAPAKLNLFLHVRDRRPDGFHDLSTVTVQLDLCDELEFETGPGFNSSSFSIETIPSNLLAARLPENETNLVVRTRELLKRVAGRDIPTAVRLIKRIPIESGLGGGSSDAAATLLALNRLWQLELTPDQLFSLATSLGSDVPLFLYSVYSQGEGRGERIQSLFDATLPRTLHFVLLKPEDGLSTSDVYRTFDAVRRENGQRSPERLIDALNRGNLHHVGKECFNSLQLPAVELMPELKDYIKAMTLPGVVKVQMTGSGSCLFALCEDETSAERVEGQYRERFPNHFVRRTRSRSAQPHSIH